MNARRHAWIDASAGVAGDMLLGALLDAGANEAVVSEAVGAVSGGAARLHTRQVRRAGLRALKVDVEALEPDPPERTWREVRTLLERAGLPQPVEQRAAAVFQRLAEAEARVHGITPDQVHFHEVGALDAIADVVGCCAALADLGIETVSAGPVALGSGSVHTRHGRLPVPAPAVAELARGWQVSCDGQVPAPGRRVPATHPQASAPSPQASARGRQVSTGGNGELATPTGMALLRTLAETCEPLPPMVLEAIGVGAGTRDPFDHANVVRILVGTTTEPAAGRGVVRRHGGEASNEPNAVRNLDHGAMVPDAAADAGDKTGMNDKAGSDDRTSVNDKTSADNRASANDNTGSNNRASANDKTSADNRASANDNTSADNRASANDNTGSNNRAGANDETGSDGNTGMIHNTGLGDEVMVLLEANVDDLDPRLWPGILAGLLDLGAADAWLVPILMKKGRPAHTLSALCHPGLVDEMRERIFRDTSTLGVRHSQRGRVVLEREFVLVAVGDAQVSVKVAHRDGVLLQVMPEFEDVAALARRQGRPERVVLQEALTAAAEDGLVVGATATPGRERNGRPSGDNGEKLSRPPA